MASVLTAGGDFVSQAGRDTTIVASRISAGNEAYLHSGDKLSLLAAQNSTHTLYDMKKNSGWGSKKTQRDEVTRITNVGTEIKTGGDLILKSEGDQTYQLAKLQNGKDITLEAVAGLKFDINQVNQETVSQSIDAMVKADPQLAWIKNAEKPHKRMSMRPSLRRAVGSLRTERNTTI